MHTYTHIHIYICIYVYVWPHEALGDDAVDVLDHGLDRDREAWHISYP